MTYRVGITFTVPTTVRDLYFDHVAQSTLYLNMLLNYLVDTEVYLICNTDNMLENPLFPMDRYNWVHIDSPQFKTLRSTFHLVIQSGFTFPLAELVLFQQHRIKCVLFQCQNEYMKELEENLFSRGTSTYPQHGLFKKARVFDEVWLTEGLEHANKPFLETRYRCPVVMVPNLWSPKLIEHLSATYPNRGLYTPRESHGRIALLDSNTDFGEYALPSVFVCESAYRTLENKDRIQKVMVSNKDNMNALQFGRFTYSTDLYADQKITIEGAFISSYFMSNHADIAVFHQWDILFKYIYLEMAWLGWGFVHNSPLLERMGYFYDKFKYNQGGKKLLYAMETHSKVYLNYFIKHRRYIQDHFVVDNKRLQETYRDHLLRLLDDRNA